MENQAVSRLYTPLRLCYGLVPIVAGADKFTNLLTDWSKYLPDVTTRIVPVSPHIFMMIVGVIEIVAGLAVLTILPRLGAHVVALWLVLIACAVTIAGYYDIAVRDLVMAFGAYTLAGLAALRGEPLLPGRATRAPPPPPLPRHTDDRPIPSLSGKEPTTVNGLSIALQPFAPFTDEELVASVVAGSSPAFELLMRRHNQRLFRTARAILRNDADAEEAVQEAYVRAFAAMPGFEGRSTVITWLSRITLHEALRARRRAGRTIPLDSANAEQHAAAARQATAADPADRTEVRTMLTAALDSLPALARAVVMLRLVEGLSTGETAECLRVTESNVKVTLHRAKQQLAESIQRETVAELRGQFSFAEARCDRIVAGVFKKLEQPTTR